jgi:AcrR family transcriptional regulator
MAPVTPTSEDALRAAMIVAAERLLAASPDHDIATRAVCEAVGVTQPVLYRLFGDKRGLLDALADDGLRRYAAQKATLAVTDDPVADLRVGWDDHTRFALSNPALYRLMFAPREKSHSVAREKIFALLEESLTRCSAIGALTMAPRQAAQMILASNIGFALGVMAEPKLFDDPGLSHRMREAAFAAILREPAEAEAPDPVAAAALRLRSQLTVSGTGALEPAETALLDRWLERLDGHTADR